MSISRNRPATSAIGSAWKASPNPDVGVCHYPQSLRRIVLFCPSKINMAFSGIRTHNALYRNHHVTIDHNGYALAVSFISNVSVGGERSERRGRFQISLLAYVQQLHRLQWSRRRISKLLITTPVSVSTAYINSRSNCDLSRSTQCVCAIVAFHNFFNALAWLGMNLSPTWSRSNRLSHLFAHVGTLSKLW